MLSRSPSTVLGKTLYVAVMVALAPAIAFAQVNEPVATDPRFPLAPMHEEVLHLPGEPARPATLEVTLFTPAGPGPFPLAVVNHGATNYSATNRAERQRFDVLGYYFLSRGYAVALPMMRGFAGSSGTIPNQGCDLAAVALADGRDIRAIVEAIGKRPDIDAGRLVVSGASFGAWNTLGFGAAPSPGTRALVGFYPAVRTSTCGTQDRSMAAGARRLAARTAVPSLWLYGDNDTVMPAASWKAVFDAYKGAGGKAELVAFGRFGTDSHQLLSHSDGMPVWVPKLDAFLIRTGLPATAVFPQYLPAAAPPPSDFAVLGDVAAVPLVDARGRERYARFLSEDRPRAFVIASNGSVASFSGGYDPLGRALQSCGQAFAGCRPYVVNDDVVWTGPKWQAGAGPVRTVSRMVRMNGDVSLGTLYSVKPDCTSNELPRVVVAEPPSHGNAVVANREQPMVTAAGGPMAACNGRRVPTVVITYKPEPGYSGTDGLVLDQTDPNGRRQIIRVELKVM